ncbi:MAG: hypothetical protein HY300_09215, partial [Verrucomicrobia bacterium]|nr:hypothetical protein [Verrucomicrobiota bacterium]
MRRVILELFLFALCGLLAGGAAEVQIKELKLKDGTVIRGDVRSFNQNGVLIRPETGGMATVPWEKCSLETLKELDKNFAAKKFTKFYLDGLQGDVDTAVAAPPPKRAPINWKDLDDRPQRPNPRTSIFAGIGTPIGGVLLVLLLLANLYASFEVAVFRNRPA